MPHTNFHDSKIRKKNIRYVCLAAITIDSIMIKKYYALFRRISMRCKSEQMIIFVDAKLKLDSSDSNGSETE